MMKKHFIFFVLFLFFSVVSHAQTVYVTGNGKKFHKKNCTVVKDGKKGIELADAKKAGYNSCAVCKPESQTIEEPKRRSK